MPANTVHPVTTETASPLQHITDPEAWLADGRWALEQWGDGTFDSRRENYVAVYMKTPVGYGNDPNALMDDYSERFQVPPERIFIKYIGS